MGQVDKFIAAVVFIIVSLYLCSNAAAQVDYYSPENVRTFAEYLLQQGDYLRAAGEFERYYVMVPESHPKDSIVLHGYLAGKATGPRHRTHGLDGSQIG